MSGVTSSVPTFKAALKASIVGALTDDTQVAYGWPGDTVERQCIWLGDVQGDMEIPTMKAGRKYRNENYTVRITIDTVIPGGTAEEAETRAYELMAFIENLLADDPGAHGVTVAQIGTFDSETALGEEGSGCRLRVEAKVQNRLL